MHKKCHEAFLLTIYLVLTGIWFGFWLKLAPVELREVIMKKFFERQIEELERLIEDNPNDPSLHKDLGNLFYRTDALFLALEEYRTALFISPEYFEAQYNLGNVYFLLV